MLEGEVVGIKDTATVLLAVTEQDMQLAETPI